MCLLAQKKKRLWTFAKHPGCDRVKVFEGVQRKLFSKSFLWKKGVSFNSFSLRLLPAKKSDYGILQNFPAVVVQKFLKDSKGNFFQKVSFGKEYGGNSF